MELLKDKRVEEQYQKLIKNILARNENYDMSNFIGGLPVTLERKDVSSITTENSAGKSNYVVTQKVDGTRMLMYIGPELESPESTKQRVVCFIDRNMKIYTLRNYNRDFLPYVNTREMLLDGELVFFDKNGDSHKELNYSLVKGISFMAFDILYGPDNIDVNMDGEKIIGQDSSMTVPDSGILRTFAWPYISRYDILYKLIVPYTFNNNEPVLTSAFKDVNWFNVEIKPVYFLNELKQFPNLYTPSGTGHLQQLLTSHRRKFYKTVLKEKYNKNVNIFINKTLKLDGLIFTSAETLYTIGAWNKPSTVQYKWKPSDEQTVDLQIKKLSNGKSNLYVMGKNKSLEIFQNKYIPVTTVVPYDVKDGAIAEFRIGKDGGFIFKELRTDKIRPNGLRAVVNVMTSFNNPVNINDLYYFLNLNETTSIDNVKKILEYSTRTKLLRCISTSNKLQLLSPDVSSKIQTMIKDIGKVKDIEIELRLGKIGSGFNPNIDEDTFSKIIEVADSYKMSKATDNFVDVYSKEPTGVRTRYIFSEDFQKFILLESIIKNRLTNLDIEMSKVWEHDIRVSASTETKISKYNIDGESHLKQRTSYTDSDKSFRLDFTVISGGKFKDRDFIQTVPIKKTRQFEIEFLKDDVNVNELFIFLTGLIRLD